MLDEQNQSQRGWPKTTTSKSERIRDEFRLPVKRVLAHRVGLLCSNSSCRASTTGPQANPSNATNIGVAAHITAAASGGPRFNESLSNTQRQHATNGIWLCQNCAKLIDSDPMTYSVNVLLEWKAQAEDCARRQIGKAKSIANNRSERQIVAALKRDHQMRDELHRALLKTPAERTNLPRGASRISKFGHSEVIVHRIGDTTYPQVDSSLGISGWFKLEILDFYHGGLETILDLQPVLLGARTRPWAWLTHEQTKIPFPCEFHVGKVFCTGRIPWRNIRHYDLRGDEFYPQPHLYCLFADSGQPYESQGFFLINNGGYEWELLPDDLVELNTLLQQVGDSDTSR